MSTHSSLVVQMEHPEKYDGFIPTNFALPVSLTDVSAHEVIQVTPGTFENVYGSGAVVANLRNGYNDVSIYTPTKNSTPGGSTIISAIGTINAKCRYPFTRNKPVTVSPDLSQTMSIGVLSAADISVVSNTVSNAVTVSGEVNAVALADFADMVKWTGSEMATLSMSPGSAVVGKSFIRPTHMYLGPDGNGEPDPVDSSKVVRVGKNVLFTEAVSGVKQSISLNFEATISGPTTSDSFDFRRTPPRQPMRVSFRWTNAGTGTFQAYVVVLWVRANADPTVAPDLQPEVHEFAYTGSSTTDDFVYPPFIVGTNKTHLNDGYAVGGLWLTTTSGQPYEWTVELLDLYSHVNYGGWRILQWDHVGVGQNISINFTGKVTGVPVGAIAPYIKQKASAEISMQEYQQIRRLFANGALQRVSYGNGGMMSGDDEDMGSTKSALSAGGRRRAALSAGGMYTGPLSAGGMYDRPVLSAGLFRDVGDAAAGIIGTAGAILDSIIPI